MTEKPFPHWKPLVPKTGAPEEDPKKKSTGPAMDYSSVAFPKPTPKKRRKK